MNNYVNDENDWVDVPDPIQAESSDSDWVDVPDDGGATSESRKGFDFGAILGKMATPTPFGGIMAGNELADQTQNSAYDATFKPLVDKLSNEKYSVANSAPAPMSLEGLVTSLGLRSAPAVSRRDIGEFLGRTAVDPRSYLFSKNVRGAVDAGGEIVSAPFRGIANQVNKRYSSALPEMVGKSRAVRALDSVNKRLGQIDSRTGQAIKNAESQFADEATQVKREFDLGRESFELEKQALRKEYEATRAQIINNQSALSNQKAEAIRRLDDVYGRKLSALEGEISKREQKLPFASRDAYTSYVDKFYDWVGKKSQKYRDDIDAAFGGKDTDVMVLSDDVVDDLTRLVEERRLGELGEEGQVLARGPVSPGEQRLLNMINDIKQRGGMSLREALRDAKYLGRNVRYGKQFKSDDSLLDDAVDILVRKAEGTVPGIKEARQAYAQFATARGRVAKAISPYNTGAKTGRKFIERVATKPDPEDMEVLGIMRKEIGEVGSQPFDEARIINELKGLRTKQGKELEFAKRSLQERVDAEIRNLEAQLAKEEAAFQNQAYAADRRAQNLSNIESMRLEEVAARKGRTVDQFIKQGQARKAVHDQRLKSATEARKKLARLSLLRKGLSALGIAGGAVYGGKLILGGE